jgi:hypothetical protein
MAAYDDSCRDSRLSIRQAVTSRHWCLTTR